MRPTFLWILTAACVAGGDDEEDEVRLPDVSEATFVDGITNPFLPFPVGATWTYEGQTDEGTERVEFVVLPDTKVIQGVTATVVQDLAYLNDALVEDTDDWFAQDTEGNVWYLGEDTCEVENDVCVNHDGAWEWGVDGALPGIVMLADPAVGTEPYYQEYYLGEAEDAGHVVDDGVAVTVPVGSFTGCITTRDFSTLDPAIEELKTYCEGVGLVVVEEDGEIVEELQATTGL
jgi:hypothetical protein